MFTVLQNEDSTSCMINIGRINCYAKSDVVKEGLKTKNIHIFTMNTKLTPNLCFKIIILT